MKGDRTKSSRVPGAISVESPSASVCLDYGRPAEKHDGNKMVTDGFDEQLPTETSRIRLRRDIETLVREFLISGTCSELCGTKHQET